MSDKETPGPRVVLPSLETPTLTKAELAELLFERLGLNKRESKDMVEAFFDIIHTTLVSGEDVARGEQALAAETRDPRTSLDHARIDEMWGDLHAGDEVVLLDDLTVEHGEDLQRVLRRLDRFKVRRHGTHVPRRVLSHNERGLAPRARGSVPRRRT